MALLPEERQYGGNDGYNDDVARFYSWNSRVPNAEALAAGDSVVLWDKKGLLGHSVIEKITHGYGTIDRRTCPHCGTGKISFRKSKSPDWRCQVCRSEFDNEHVERVDVVTFRAEYSEAWIAMPGYLTAPAVRLLAYSPKSQHAMREADPMKVGKLLRPRSRYVRPTPAL